MMAIEISICTCNDSVIIGIIEYHAGGLYIIQTS